MRAVKAWLVVAAALVTVVGGPATNAVAGGPVVGYYDMWPGEGNPDQVPGIEAAGGTPVNIFDLSMAELNGINVLLIQNPFNGSFGGEYLDQLPTISSWVANGGVMILHDRCVENCDGGGGGDFNRTSVGPMLPGGTGIVTVRDFEFDADIDVLDPSTLVTNGPGGVVADDTLDGGTSSSHGYIEASSLPGGSLNPLARGNGGVGDENARGALSAPESGTQTGNRTGGGSLFGGSTVIPEEVVTTCYPHQAGRVIYSTIPLDYYLGGDGPPEVQENMANIYTPNVIAWGMAHCGGGGPDGQLLNLYLHTNGAGPNRHAARVEGINRGPGATGRVTLAVFQQGTNPQSVQSQAVGLAMNQMGSWWFSFTKPGGGAMGWQTTSYLVRACLELTGDTRPGNNCMTKSFSM